MSVSSPSPANVTCATQTSWTARSPNSTSKASSSSNPYFMSCSAISFQFSRYTVVTGNTVRGRGKKHSCSSFELSAAATFSYKITTTSCRNFHTVDRSVFNDTLHTLYNDTLHTLYKDNSTEDKIILQFKYLLPSFHKGDSGLQLAFSNHQSKQPMAEDRLKPKCDCLAVPRAYYRYILLGVEVNEVHDVNRFPPLFLFAPSLAHDDLQDSSNVRVI